MGHPARDHGRPWRRLKAQIIRRDGGVCHICGQPGADSADHLVPVAHGGAEWDPANLDREQHVSAKRTRRTRKHRRSAKASFNRNDPGPRHHLTAGRTGKVAQVKRKSLHR